MREVSSRAAVMSGDFSIEEENLLSFEGLQ